MPLGIEGDPLQQECRITGVLPQQACVIRAQQDRFELLTRPRRPDAVPVSQHVVQTGVLQIAVDQTREATDREPAGLDHDRLVVGRSEPLERHDRFAQRDPERSRHGRTGRLHPERLHVGAGLHPAARSRD